MRILHTPLTMHTQPLPLLIHTHTLPPLQHRLSHPNRIRMYIPTPLRAPHLPPLLPMHSRIPGLVQPTRTQLQLHRLADIPKYRTPGT
jgi:hypothetical protein